MFSPQDIHTSNILQTNHSVYILNTVQYNTMDEKRVHNLEVGQGRFGGRKWKREIV